MKVTPGKLDVFLILPLGASLLMISEAPATELISPIWSELAQASILGGATLLLTLLVAKATAIDRRCAEDYIFQVMANAALVAIGSMALANVFWLLATKFYAIPELTGQNMTGIAFLAWILSYYWYRLRGLRP